MIISKPQREAHEKRIHSSNYVAHVLPPAKRYQPGTLDNSESMMVDVGFNSTTHSNSEMMLVDEEAPIVSRNSFSVFAAPVQASTSQTNDTQNLIAVLKHHNQIIHWLQALRYYHLALQHLFHMPINGKGDVCCVWRQADWHLTAQVEGEELIANSRCVYYFYY